MKTNATARSGHTRRRVLAGLATCGAGALISPPALAAAPERLETAAVRLINDKVICEAPLMIAAELLRADGFTDVHYVEVPDDDPDIVGRSVADGKVDFGLNFALFQVAAIELFGRQTVLAGVHVGCFELFAREGIHGIADLKGKRVGLQTSPPDLLSLMALQVGLDPAKDIRWVAPKAFLEQSGVFRRGDYAKEPHEMPLDAFAAGEIDAFLGFPPEPQQLRARGAGHVILNTSIDRPWSQYYCCTLVGNRDYVKQHPVATKRLVRAILKATELCAAEPAGAARRIVDGGFTPSYDDVLQTLSDITYRSWRDYDIEDTLRFYALRLHEAGLIKSSPQKIIAQGTDWRFLNDAKRELKG